MLGAISNQVQTLAVAQQAKAESGPQGTKLEKAHEALRQAKQLKIQMANGRQEAARQTLERVGKQLDVLRQFGDIGSSKVNARTAARLARELTQAVGAYGKGRSAENAAQPEAVAAKRDVDAKFMDNARFILRHTEFVLNQQHRRIEVEGGRLGDSGRYDKAIEDAGRAVAGLAKQIYAETSAQAATAQGHGLNIIA